MVPLQSPGMGLSRELIGFWIAMDAARSKGVTTLCDALGHGGGPTHGQPRAMDGSERSASTIFVTSGVVYVG